MAERLEVPENRAQHQQCQKHLKNSSSASRSRSETNVTSIMGEFFHGIFSSFDDIFFFVFEKNLVILTVL